MPGTEDKSMPMHFGTRQPHVKAGALRMAIQSLISPTLKNTRGGYPAGSVAGCVEGTAGDEVQSAASPSQMKIGIIGTRGIPNRYGGFEQFATFVAPRLVEMGHHVVVYNSSLNGYRQKHWNGVEIVTKYDAERITGSASQFAYDLFCILDARKRNFDVIFQLGYTTSSVWSFLFPKNSLIVTNPDGMEWRREKYKPAVRWFLRHAEKWAVKNSDVLIADARAIRDYIWGKYQREAVYIPYGAVPLYKFDPSVPAAFNLTAYRYNLVIARSEPENNLEMIIRGCLESGDRKPLLIIGNTNGYGRYLRKKYTDPRILFKDCIYDMALLNNLRHYSNLYFHGHSAGGTNPSLLEAMGSGCVIVAHDNIFNREVLGDDAYYFKNKQQITLLLNEKIHKLEHRPMVDHNRTKISSWYNWENILRLIETHVLKVKHNHYVHRS